MSGNKGSKQKFTFPTLCEPGQYAVLPRWRELTPESLTVNPDLSGVDSVETLAEALKDLMASVEVESVREVVRRCVYNLPSRTTLRMMLMGKRLPSRDVMVIFVQALAPGLDIEPWNQAWDRAAATLTEIPRQGSIHSSRRV